MNQTPFHIPVLGKEVIDYLVTDETGIYIDGTLGGGGHSKLICEKIKKNGKVIGLDRDSEAIGFAAQQLKEFNERVKIIQGNYAKLKEILDTEKIFQVDGILIDLGVSSHQIDTTQRGFSYLTSGPLDMRMDMNTTLTAQHIINNYDEKLLVDIFRRFGEEQFAKSIARAIVYHRKQWEITNTIQLKDIVTKAVPFKSRIRSLSRVFQAIRIAINCELDNLSQLLNQSITLLKTGGHVVIISYHSLEDRLVKEFFRLQAHPCTCPVDFPQCVCGKQPVLRILTKHAIKASPVEIAENIRSHSARLRAAERL
jgi:16S rRNA (cytosine1402-N4)-methyltransferase